MVIKTITVEVRLKAYSLITFLKIYNVRRRRVSDIYDLTNKSSKFNNSKFYNIMKHKREGLIL